MEKSAEYVGIDKDMLELAKRDFDKVTIGDDKEINRIIFNYHAESTKLLSDVVSNLALQNEMLSIIYQDEIAEFIIEVGKNSEKKDKE